VNGPANADVTSTGTSYRDCRTITVCLAIVIDAAKRRAPGNTVSP
jgi:hypothetical protein